MATPRTGKTHLLCGLGQELVRRGRTVLFTPTFQIVQGLLAAKRKLRLASELKRLDRFEAVIVNDIGYVQQSREEMDVLLGRLRKSLREYAARFPRRRPQTQALLPQLRGERRAKTKKENDPAVLIVANPQF